MFYFQVVAGLLSGDLNCDGSIRRHNVKSQMTSNGGDIAPVSPVHDEANNESEVHRTISFNLTSSPTDLEGLLVTLNAMDKLEFPHDHQDNILKVIF